MKVIKEVQEWKEEMKVMKEESREEVKKEIGEQGEKIRWEIKGMKKEFREREERWRENRENVEKRLKELECRDKGGKREKGRTRKREEGERIYRRESQGNGEKDGDEGKRRKKEEYNY